MADTLLKSALETEAKRKEAESKTAWKNKVATPDKDGQRKLKEDVAVEALSQIGINLKPLPESKLKEGQQVTSLKTPS